MAKRTGALPGRVEGDPLERLVAVQIDGLLRRRLGNRKLERDVDRRAFVLDAQGERRGPQAAVAAVRRVVDDLRYAVAHDVAKRKVVVDFDGEIDLAPE